MTGQQFSYPLTPCDQERVVQLLESLQDVKVGQCSLFPEKADGWIWGTNPYGIDGIAGKSLDRIGALNAIEWVQRQEETQDEHG